MRERCLGIALFGFIIKNPVLLESLNYKLNRILNFEATNHNYFRQHITDIKESLIKELEIDFGSLLIWSILSAAV